MAEQLICNQQVDGSIPFTSSNESEAFFGLIYGGIPERPKGADCKSVVTDFAGPNPASPTNKKGTFGRQKFLFLFIQAAGLVYHPTQVGIASRARCALVSHHAPACILLRLDDIPQQVADVRNAVTE